MDLIERQAAIDAVVKRYDEYGRTAKCEELASAIEEVPSAQPERLTDDDFETIRIHLSAYKEWLCNQRRWKEAEEYQRIIDRFMSFASAQSEVEVISENTIQIIVDMDIVDVDRILLSQKGTHWGNLFYIDEDTEQPEIIRCGECVNYDTSWIPHSVPDRHYCPTMDSFMPDDGYCSFAERRTDE